MTRLYCPEQIVEDNVLTLPKELSHRLKNVLRIKKDEIITLFNGSGEEWSAIITVVDKLVTVRIQKKVKPIIESPVQIRLGQVISRGERMDYTIQKAVELGVTHITPLTSEFCQVKLSTDRWQKRKEHWQGVIISACEQSGRAILPELDDVQTLSEYFENCREEQKLILHPHLLNKEDCQMRWVGPYDANKAVTVLVGAEGGFANEEVEVAIKRGFLTWQLGPRILRTETAGLAAIAILQWECGDFKST